MRDETNASEALRAAGTGDGEAGESTSQARALAQLTLIEQSLTASLAEARRGQLLQYLTERRHSWTAEEIAAVPDGTEPALVFQPATLAGYAQREKAQRHE